MVHEGAGKTLRTANKQSFLLTEPGYTALTVGMYGRGKTASQPDDAVKFSEEIKENIPWHGNNLLSIWCVPVGSLIGLPVLTAG